MKPNKQHDFRQDIQNLLCYYFNKTELNNLWNKLNNSDVRKNNSIDAVNKFYAQQLKIESNFAKERLDIDRTITFAQKNLEKEKYLQLLRKLGQICTMHGKLNLAYEILKKAIKESDCINDKAEGQILLADVYSRHADWSKSIEALNNAIHLFEAAKNEKGIARCENLLGAIYGEKGELEEAKKHFEKSLTLLNQEKEMIASIESNLGIIENIRGNYSKAFEYFKRSLRNFELMGNHRRVAELRHNMGMLNVSLSKLSEAIDEFDQCIEISQKNGFMPILALTLLSKANVLLAKDELDAAEMFANKSMEISHQIDDKLTLADIYKTKSLIEKRRKNYQKAESYLKSSLRLNNKVNNLLNSAETNLELGKLYGELSRFQEQELYLRQALDQYRGMMAAEKIQQIEEMLSTRVVS